MLVSQQQMNTEKYFMLAGLIILFLVITVCLSSVISYTQKIRAQLPQPSFANQKNKEALTNNTTTGPSANTNIGSSNMTIYNNSDSRITIQYPSNWRLSDRSLPSYSQVVAFYSPLENLTDTFPVRVSIDRFDYAQNISQGGYTSLTLNATTALGLNITESKSATLSGKPAHELIFSTGTRSD